MTHEGVVQVIRNNPAVVTSILQGELGVVLPPFQEIRLESADVGDLKPAEFRADLVALLVAEKRPVRAVIVEVQLDRDPRKRRSWPAYIVNLRARLRCHVCLLVIAPDLRIARWCGRAIETGHPGFVLTPLVLGPNNVPVITEPARALQEPELAVLSAVAHGKGEHGLAIAKAAFAAFKGLDDDRETLYADLSFLSLNEAAKRALEAMMKNGYEYQSDFARKYFGQGLEKGREVGREEGLAQAVLDVLDTRGLRIPKVVRERVLSCADISEVSRWLRRAVTVAKARDIFGEPAM